ncbi:hypothetical protein ABLE91_06080 [Aquabacter sp. CN5-332]|uniref:hypothetical protein n=1 Tax=Aquabacter sp. CN5-332 TaxID=3156608 RepID=UPI0032B4C311
MQINILDIIIFLTTIAGGMLGTYIAGASAWKGGVIAGLALIISVAIVEVANLEQPIVESLIYLVAVGLVGGRFAMKLTTRQLISVVLGSFLVPLVAALVAIYAFGLS